MTEVEWLGSSDPQAMLTFLSHRCVDAARKHRLFACACCRRIWDRFPDPRNRDLVVAVEDYPDLTFGDPEIHDPACASSAREHEFRDYPAYWAAKYLGRGFYKMTAAVSAAVVSARILSLAATERNPQTSILHEVFGNPFRPVTFASEWRTETVVLLARQMYDGREFSAMPILADALQDAGCDNEHVLSHCRDTKQVHVRGCWVVDELLQKQ